MLLLIQLKVASYHQLVAWLCIHIHRPNLPGMIAPEELRILEESLQVGGLRRHVHGELNVSVPGEDFRCRKIV